MSTIGELGEAALLDRLARLLRRPRADVTVGIGDDGAVLAGSEAVVATVDSVVAGTDWLVTGTPRRAIGHRAIAVNLSDLAAMGARPAHLLLALELPAALRVDGLMDSIAGALALADQYDAVVVGGDIGIGQGPERWTVTALGRLPGRPMLRSAARPGDRLWLIGDVGAAAVGLRALREGSTVSGLRHCIAAHQMPQPLVSAGLSLSASGERLAAIDISDGLWLDGSRMAMASEVELVIELPEPHWLTAGVKTFCLSSGLDWRRACAGGGDDYALLVAAPEPLDLANLLSKARPIGHVVAGSGNVSLSISGETMTGAPAGYQHGDR